MLGENVRRQILNTQHKHRITFIANRDKVLNEVRIHITLQNSSHKCDLLRSSSQILSSDHGLNLVHMLEELLTSTTIEVWHLNLVDRRVSSAGLECSFRVEYEPLAYTFSSFLISGIRGTTSALEGLLEERTTFILTP